MILGKRQRRERRSRISHINLLFHKDFCLIKTLMNLNLLLKLKEKKARLEADKNQR